MKNRQDNLGEVVLYKTEDGKTALDVRLAGETVWLAQAQIADLFGVNVPAISKHVKNIFSARELSPKATVSKMEIVRTEGKRRVKRDVEVYNLDIIIPGFGLHTLHTAPKRYAISVNGPWRITFEWVEGDAWRVDLEQYH